jgi:hypothetical protein
MRIGFLLLGGIGLAIGLRRMTNAAHGRQRHSSRSEIISSCQTQPHTESFAAHRIDVPPYPPITAWHSDTMHSAGYGGLRSGGEQMPPAWRQSARRLSWIAGGVMTFLGMRRSDVTGRVVSIAGLGIWVRGLISEWQGRHRLQQPPPEGLRLVNTERTPAVPSRGAVPLWITTPYALFLSVLVPVYLVHYGPSNFLWFSDIALLVTLAALWWESPLLASTQAVSVTLLESVWTLDFLLGLTTGASPFGLAAYMFDPALSLFLRALSLFHLVLPVLLLWLVFRLGYDRRAWTVQTLVAWLVLPLCYCCTAPAANINWVFGPGAQPQTWLAPFHYFLLVMAVFPFGVYLPTHLLFQWWCSRLWSCGSEAGSDLDLAYVSRDRKELHADL